MVTESGVCSHLPHVLRTRRDTPRCEILRGRLGTRTRVDETALVENHSQDPITRERPDEELLADQHHPRAGPHRGALVPIQLLGLQ